MSRRTKHLYKYQLANFVNERTTDGKQSIECVPSSWIKFDPQLGSCVARFMGPPYDDEATALLSDLIKNNVVVPEDWPFYECALIGHANTYEDAMIRLESLQKEPYAYTTDYEEPQQKAGAMTNLYKALRSNKHDDLQKIMDVTNITFAGNKKSDSEQSYSPEVSSEAHSSSEEETGQHKRGRNQKTKKGKGTKKRPEKVAPKRIASRSTTAKVTPKPITKASSTPQSSISLAGRKISFAGSSKSQPEKFTSKSRDRGTLLPVQLPKPLCATAGLEANNSAEEIRNAAVLDEAQALESQESTRRPDENDATGNSDVELAEGMQENITFSKDTKLLYIAIKQQLCLIKALSEDQRQLRNAVERNMRLKVNKMTLKKFEEKYSFQKPRTPEEFATIDRRFAADEEFRKDFADTLESLFESDVKPTINTILKNFISRELAMNCCAVRLPKVKSTKLILKGTAFYDNILAFIKEYFTGPQDTVMSEKTFYQNLSSCISNAKDWDGHRNMRRPLPVLIIEQEHA